MVIVIQQGQPVVVMINDIQHLPGIQSVNGTSHQFNHLPQLTHAVLCTISPLIWHSRRRSVAQMRN